MSLLRPIASRAVGPFDDLTPNQFTFTGRRGATYTAWDPSTYEVAFSTPDSTFPWDWTSLLGEQGAIALAGNNNVAATFAFSDPASLSGVARGDIMRVKGRDIHSLAHLTKIGLVIGSGVSAQRAWFSQGTITEYLLVPHYVGYKATVLGRHVTVRLSDLAVADFQTVGVIEVSIDNPTDARFYFASDLEPALSYSYAIEFRNTPDTRVSYRTADQAIQGLATLNTAEETAYGNLVLVYLYAHQPLSSWSANNLSFDAYLNADPLDGQTASGTHDGRVAIATVAQPVQYFFIGNMILDSATRADPTGLVEALHARRLAALNQLPVVDSLALPRFKFVNLMSNLFNTCMINRPPPTRKGIELPSPHRGRLS